MSIFCFCSYFMVISKVVFLIFLLDKYSSTHMQVMIMFTVIIKIMSAYFLIKYFLSEWYVMAKFLFEWCKNMGSKKTFRQSDTMDTRLEWLPGPLSLIGNLWWLRNPSIPPLWAIKFGGFSSVCLVPVGACGNPYNLRHKKSKDEMLLYSQNCDCMVAYILLCPSVYIFGFP